MRQNEERQKTGRYSWLYGIIAGSCVAAMQIGMGMLTMERNAAIILGGAQGMLVCSLTVICGYMIEWMIQPLPQQDNGERYMYPLRQRAQESGTVFRALARSFASVRDDSGVGQAQLISGDAAVLDGTEKMNILWGTRLNENRAAVAAQLDEMAQIMTDTMEHACDTRYDAELETLLSKKLKSMGLRVHSVLVYEQENKRREIYLTVNTRRRKCVAVKDIAAALTRLTGRPMMAARDSRAFVGGEKITVSFAERTNFEVLYAAEKAVKGDERVSGDNFSLQYLRNGQFLAALSDGMGSGINAYRESELVIDLLEQFLEAGFSRETAVRMINSTLIVRSDAQVFSTIDMSQIDLYTGVCRFMKVGASTTYIRRDGWVEIITSTSLPAGVFHTLSPENIDKKLYDGDMVIMVTDGVLDALPAAHQEEMMKEIIMEHRTGNPNELASYILGRVRQYSPGAPLDDMTVLVMGVVKR